MLSLQMETINKKIEYMYMCVHTYIVTNSYMYIIYMCMFMYIYVYM